MNQKMMIRCVWEHRGEDTLLWSVDYPGAFARGASLAEAMEKLPRDLAAWSVWTGGDVLAFGNVQIIADVPNSLEVRDADSDVLFTFLSHFICFANASISLR